MGWGGVDPRSARYAAALGRRLVVLFTVRVGVCRRLILRQRRLRAVACAALLTRELGLNDSHFGPLECSGCGSCDANASDGIPAAHRLRAARAWMRTSPRRTRARAGKPAGAPAALSARGRAPASRSRVRPRLHCICQNRRKNERRSCPASQPFRPCRGWLASSRPSPRAAQKRTARACTCVRALGPTLALSPSLAPPSLYASRRVVLGLDWPWPGSAPLVNAACWMLYAGCMDCRQAQPGGWSVPWENECTSSSFSDERQCERMSITSSSCGAHAADPGVHTEPVQPLYDAPRDQDLRACRAALWSC